MAVRAHLKPTDLQGIAQLAVDATIGVTGIVESMHHTIASGSGILGASPAGGAGGISGWVYRAVRGVTRLSGAGIQAAMRPLIPWFAETAGSAEREAVISAMNGVMGDRLLESANPLALIMQLRVNGVALEPSPNSLAAAFPASSDRLLLTLHGLCMSDHCWRWNGHDHAAELAAHHQMTRLDLNYNSGLHISANGHALSKLLETLIDAWPVRLKEIHFLCHSMGGLVARSAMHSAANSRHHWLDRLAKVFFLGTPHLGAPLERGGHGMDTLLTMSPYVAPFARLGQIRSAGITDLRYANLRDEDWQDVDRFARTARRPTALPLPPRVDCFAVAAVTGERQGDVKSRLIGDGLVPVASALGQHRIKKWSLNIPEVRRRIVTGTHHMDLLGSKEVCNQLSEWLNC